MGFGVKVSKAGFDVKSTGNQNLIINSDLYGSMKIAQIGGNYFQTITVSVPLTGGGDPGNVYETTLAHGLGYVPAFFCVCQDNIGGGSQWGPVPSGGFGQYRCYTNSTNIVGRVATTPGGTPAFTVTFKVTVFKEKIN